MHLMRYIRFFLLKAFLPAFLAYVPVLRAQGPTPVPYDHNEAVGRFYDIRGFKMYTEVYGSGPPLLMIHGNNDNMSAFAKNVPYFATHYRVILADSRLRADRPTRCNPSSSR